MARERRTNITKSLVEAGEKKKIPQRRQTGNLNRPTHNAASPARRNNARPAVRKSNSNIALLIVLAVVAGGGWGGYRYYQKQQQLKAEAARVEAENARRLKQAEEERIAALKQKEKEEAEAAARRKKEAEIAEKARKANAEEAARRNAEKAALARKAAEEKMKKAEKPREITEKSPEFLAAVKEARAHLRTGEWDEATAGFAKASKLPAPQADLEKAQALGEAAAFFKKVSAETPLAVETKAENLFRITTKNSAKPMQGKLDKSLCDHETLVFIKDGNVKHSIPRKDVKKQEPVSQKERDQQMVADINKRKAQIHNDAIAMYFCGVKALEYDLKKMAAECFAVAAKKDANIAKAVPEFLAGRLFAAAILERNLGNSKRADAKINELKSKYPQSQAARKIDGTLREAEELAKALKAQKEERARIAKLKREEAEAARRELKKKQEEQKAKKEGNQDLIAINEEVEAAAADIADTKVDSSTVGRADKLVSVAREKMKIARTCDSREIANKNYKEALGEFRQAAALYEKALDAKGGKGDSGLENKIDDVRKNLYWCRKLQTL